MNNENYYQILGVNENASHDEIKKTYRKLAKENHPDVGGSEEKFKKISLAYDTIGYEEKRKQYDAQIKNPFLNGQENVDMSDFLSQMFGGNRQNQNKVSTTTISIDIGVLESYRGDVKNITYQRNKKCEPCNGNGGDKKICSSCNGKGTFTRQVGSGFFIQVVQMECQQCQGNGKIIIKPCFLCNGSGKQKEIKTVEVKLPHGVDNGHHIRIKSMGDFINGVYGDLIIRINLKPEGNFNRFDSHLVYNAYIDLEQLKNGSITVSHPDGNLILKLPKNIDTSIPLRVKLKGFKIDSIGDLIVNQYVKYVRD